MIHYSTFSKADLKEASEEFSSSLESSSSKAAISGLSSQRETVSHL